MRDTPAGVHRAWLSGLLTNSEFIVHLDRIGADEETVRREVPDSELLREYFEFVRDRRSESEDVTVSEGDTAWPPRR